MKTGALAADHPLTLVARNRTAIVRSRERIGESVESAGESEGLAKLVEKFGREVGLSIGGWESAGRVSLSSCGWPLKPTFGHASANPAHGFCYGGFG